jgi:hypothetical protein
VVDDCDPVVGLSKIAKPSGTPEIIRQLQAPSSLEARNFGPNNSSALREFTPAPTSTSTSTSTPTRRWCHRW